MRKRNAVCIVQARMGSSRLPGKVLSDAGGRPMLDQVVGRLQRAKTLDRIIVATSDRAQDRAIVDHCAALGWDVFAGDHDDVLKRFARAAEHHAAGIVVRVTADCPLIEPRVVDATVRLMLADSTLDYASNVFPRRTFPRGLDVEAMSSEVLYRLDASTVEPRFREHVTLAIHASPEQYRIGSLMSDQDCSTLRWTVDTPADLKLVQAIYASFRKRSFSWRDVLAAYRTHPHWREVNAHVLQKAA